MLQRVRCCCPALLDADQSLIGRLGREFLELVAAEVQQLHVLLNQTSGFDPTVQVGSEIR